MKSHNENLTFNAPERMDFVNVTRDLSFCGSPPPGQRVHLSEPGRPAQAPE